jgi:hypothetical protein
MTEMARRILLFGDQAMATGISFTPPTKAFIMFHGEPTVISLSLGTTTEIRSGILLSGGQAMATGISLTLLMEVILLLNSEGPNNILFRVSYSLIY